MDMSFNKPSWTRSISFKVLLAYIVGAVLTITFVVLFILWIVIYQSNWLAAEDVADFTQEMAKELKFDQQGMPFVFQDNGDDLNWVFESLEQETAYRVLNMDGETVLISGGGEAFWRTDAPSKPIQEGKFDFKRNGLQFYGATASIQHNDQWWYVQFAVSHRFLYLMHRGFALPFMGFGIVVFSVALLFVFGLCAFITLNYTLKPLRDVSESAAAIAPRSINARLSAEKIPSEIFPLVDSFNKTLDRLEKGYQIQREFLATAAHELKTPLSLIRAQVDLKERGIDREMLLNDVTHMSRQVQQLLVLAEVSEEQNYNVVTIKVKDAVDEVVTYLRPMFELREIHIKVNCMTEALWQADRAALFTLLKNLLENAIQHAPKDTEITISISRSEVSIRDRGQGVTQEQLAKLFVRFWRGEHRRDHGAGLGLSICQEIAQTHHWSLTAHRVAPGLCFHLSNQTS